MSLMPSIHPHLTILRPSSTTVSFTVSTSSPPQTFASHVTTWLLLGFRVLLAALTLFVLAAKYLHLHSTFFTCLSDGLDLVSWLYVCTGAAVALFLVFRRFHTGMLCFLVMRHHVDFYNIFLLSFFRRESPCTTNTRDSNLYYLAVLSPASYHSVHSNFTGSRYLRSRSFQRFRGQVLSCYCC